MRCWAAVGIRQPSPGVNKPGSQRFTEHVLRKQSLHKAGFEMTFWALVDTKTKVLSADSNEITDSKTRALNKIFWDITRESVELRQCKRGGQTRSAAMTAGHHCRTEKRGADAETPLHVAELLHTFQVNLMWTKLYMGFPDGSEVKASACNAGDLGSIPGSGRSPGEMANHFSILAWRIPWTEEPGGLWASLVARMLKTPPAMQETWV